MANDKAIFDVTCLSCRQAQQKRESISDYNSAENALPEGDGVYGSLAYQCH